ncbi:MAG: class I SAM-dependent methyltransferase [Reyranella sp.]|uniref:class I SAM-dependent methyltransferase n=1 Tax=Reyranella sp. TaxID=1929291 RepID=UPI001AC03F7D|nr:class I SAM-dependent methyltransferase [Reyranella sp.]MBN9088894.1 class I SAM-dependent methyltransferase [Reyranella sp.]
MSQTTPSKTADKKFYDAETHYFSDPSFMTDHQAVVETYVAKYRATLAALAKRKGRKLKTLELGAGTCTLSLTLSREPWIGAMHCTDISAHRMDSLARTVAQHIGGRIELLTFGEADFTDPLRFGDGQFDVVLFDAALHHSRNMWTTLRECHRVLADDGLLIAQREQYAAPLTYPWALRKLLRSEEVAAGVTENSYLKAQYEYYMRATGFRPTFLPVGHRQLPGLWFLNGLVFSKWVIVAERRLTCPALD